MMRKIVIAIDGVSGSGKSTTAREVAHVLGYMHIDSGAMYRAITLYLLRQEIELTDVKRIVDVLKDIDIRFGKHAKTGDMDVYIEGRNVESEIRKATVSERVSQVSAIKEVRDVLVRIQQRLGKGKGVVMDGRDIGTAVFPQADLKLFMTADLTVRSIRRHRELRHDSRPTSTEGIAESLARRDKKDCTRSLSPLQKANDAIAIDTTYMTFDEQVDEIVRLALPKIIATK